MRVLVIGGGGREHALAWKIAQSPKVEKIFCTPGNAGTAELAENVPLAADRVDDLLDFARDQKIDLTVVGPEQPLVLGIADRFESAGLRLFGPTARAAEIEGSKVFCKDLLRKYGIPTAEYASASTAEEAKNYVRQRGGSIVVKADGLAAGKGVFVCDTPDEAIQAITAIMEEKIFGDSGAGSHVVLEERLEGPEVSLLAFTDGQTVLPLDSAQDHKAVYDGDRGPNTGGMGAYSPAPVLTPDLRRRVMDEILIPAVQALAGEGRPYRGILYAGLMITADGPKVLEFNARFGDPETQPLVLRLATDIVPVFEACLDGTLDRVRLEWKPDAAVCVVMAAAGYPGSYEKGNVISGLEEAAAQPGVVVFHAGTKQADGQVVTHGGRVLGVTALGPDTAAAIDHAYRAVKLLSWDGVHYRTDIGRQAVGDRRSGA